MRTAFDILNLNMLECKIRRVSERFKLIEFDCSMGRVFDLSRFFNKILKYFNKSIDFEYFFEL